MSTIKLYKIRNKETGQFSKGGVDSAPYIWTKVGKTWNNIGHVKNHLRSYMNGDTVHYRFPYKNAEIVEVEVSFDEGKAINVNDFINNELIKGE